MASYQKRARGGKERTRRRWSPVAAFIKTARASGSRLGSGEMGRGAGWGAAALGQVRPSRPRKSDVDGKKQ